MNQARPTHGDSTPVEPWLEAVRDSWNAFAEARSQRLLIWLATEHEAPLLHAFFAEECDVYSAATPDLFLHLESAFDGSAHGCALATELVSHYEQVAREGLPEPRWRAPRVLARHDDIETLIRVLTSFRAHHVDHDACSKLAVWLDPARITPERDYTLWLRRLARRAPDELRFVSVVPPHGPELALARDDDACIVFARCAAVDSAGLDVN